MTALLPDPTRGAAGMRHLMIRIWDHHEGGTDVVHRPPRIQCSYERAQSATRTSLMYNDVVSCAAPCQERGGAATLAPLL